MNYCKLKMVKYVIMLFCLCFVSPCFAGNLSLQLVADSGTVDSNSLDPDGKTTTKWYPVLNKINDKVSSLDNIATRKNGNKLEVLLYCSDTDITSKDIASVQDARGRYNEPILLINLNKDAHKKLTDLTTQNIGKCFAEVVNNEIVSIIPIVHPVRNTFALYNVTWDELKNVLASQNLSVPHYRDNQSIPQFTIWHLLVFLIIILAVILGLIPAKEMPRKKTPRVWVSVFAIVLGILGSCILGISRTTGLVESTKDSKAMVIEYHISLLYLVLGAVAGVAVGILCSYPVWFMFRRALFNVTRVFKRNSDSKA